jgi:hypothetical protein
MAKAERMIKEMQLQHDNVTCHLQERLEHAMNAAAAGALSCCCCCHGS